MQISRPVAMRIVVTLAVWAAASLAAVSIVRAGTLRYDFHHFYTDARYLIETGRLNTADHLPAKLGGPHLPWYLPVATIAFVPFAVLGPWVGGALWSLVNLASLWAAIRLVGIRLIGLPRRDWLLHQMLPVCLCGAVIYEHARFNQLGVVVLVLLLISFALLQRGRDVWAGAALALACLLKLVPVVFLVWLVLKRRWRALAASLAVMILFGLAPCLAVFGPSRTVEYHKRWVSNAVLNGSALRMLLRADDPLYAQRHQTFVDYRNQSLAMVVGRITGLVPAFAPQPVRSSWRVSTAVTAYVLINLLVVGSLLWVSRRPWRQLGAQQRACEFAVWLLAMLWLSPLMRQYYLVWAYPAIAILLADADLARAAGRRMWPFWLAIGAWLFGMLAWGVDGWFFDHAARKLGVNLWSILVLGAVLAWQRWGGPAEPLKDGLSTSAA